MWSLTEAAICAEIEPTTRFRNHHSRRYSRTGRGRKESFGYQPAIQRQISGRKGGHAARRSQRLRPVSSRSLPADTETQPDQTERARLTPPSRIVHSTSPIQGTPQTVSAESWESRDGTMELDETALATCSSSSNTFARTVASDMRSHTLFDIGPVTNTDISFSAPSCIGANSFSSCKCNHGQQSAFAIDALPRDATNGMQEAGRKTAQGTQYMVSPHGPSYMYQPSCMPFGNHVQYPTHRTAFQNSLAMSPWQQQYPQLFNPLDSPISISTQVPQGPAYIGYVHPCAAPEYFNWPSQLQRPVAYSEFDLGFGIAHTLPGSSPFESPTSVPDMTIPLPMGNHDANVAPNSIAAQHDPEGTVNPSALFSIPDADLNMASNNNGGGAIQTSSTELFDSRGASDDTICSSGPEMDSLFVDLEAESKT